MQFEHSELRIDQLKSALDRLEPYIDHRNNCTSRSGDGPKGDFCTCDVDEVVEDVDAALESLKAFNRRENSKSIATEFGTNGETNSDGHLKWWFKCPKCQSKQICVGNPDDFANRPYACSSCSWSAMLSGARMKSLRKTHRNIMGDNQ